jgi:hypothetical protein
MLVESISKSISKILFTYSQKNTSRAVKKNNTTSCKSLYQNKNKCSNRTRFKIYTGCKSHLITFYSYKLVFMKIICG